jgi:protein ImuB
VGTNIEFLRNFAYSFSPLIEETAPDTVVLDVEGCELRFGSAYGLANEIALHAVRSTAAGGLASRVNVALAGNPDTAVFAAKFLKGVTFIASGEELTALGELAVENLFSPRPNVHSPRSGPHNSNLNTPNSGLNKETLDFGPWTLDWKQGQEILETLRLWGVRTFREFANLPTPGVAGRLGQEGVRLQQLAAGKTERHLKLIQPAPVFDNSIELDHPLTELEPLSFIFARLLNQLCARLLAYALATNELRVRLKLEDRTLHERTLNLPHPLRDHKVFLKLLLLDTELHPPQKAVIAVAIACEPVKPRVLQTGLFIPQVPEPAKLELTLARLAKLVGVGNVGSPQILDTHRPDSFQVKRFFVKNGGERKKRRGDKEKGRLGDAPPPPVPVGFRIFRPPLRAMVDASRGYPLQLSAWGPNRSVYGKVVRLAGPWRKTGDWWRDDCWARDEWDVAVETRIGMAGEQTRTKLSHALYRIYRELRSGAWFVEGAYD